MSGPATSTTTAGSSGDYSLSGLTNGAYIVTPSSSGYSFTPAQQSVTINGASQGSVNFTVSQISYSVGLTWVGSTLAAGYNVYRGTADTKINSALITSPSYTDSFVTNGDTYYYVCTEVDSAGTESAYSSQATAQIP